MDFGAPKVSLECDQGRMKKLAQRVEGALTDCLVFKEPKQLDPHALLVSHLNRDGAPPNVQHVHFVILKSIV